MGSEHEHILMLPFLAQGHLIPFLELARKIHQRIAGFTITIVSTPLNIHYLRSTISSHSNIYLAELPFCSTDHGLQPDTENTEKLSANNLLTFCHASVTLEAPFRNLVHDIMEQDGRPPLCIISDVFFGWAVNVAKSVGSKSVTFTTCGAYGTAAYMSFWLNFPHRHTDCEEFTLPGFPDSHRFHRSHLHQSAKAADGADKWSAFMQSQISLSLGSQVWLCNTVEEIEPLGLEVLRKYLKLPVCAVGPLLSSAALKKGSYSSPFGSNSHVCQRTGKKPGIFHKKCFEWLNIHGPDSVVYISFGSQNTISASQMRELALGLEVCGKPFIWVLRPPIGFDMKGESRGGWLPEGFEKRMTDSKQGLLVHNWAPQLEILAHESTGAFLSHCGWNSVLESLSQGVPIIGWPMGAEQTYNTKMLVEEMGVCEVLARAVQCDVAGKEVKRVIELVMDKKKGKGLEMKKKAAEIGERIRAAAGKDQDHGKDVPSIKALDQFVRTILTKTTLDLP